MYVTVFKRHEYSFSLLTSLCVTTGRIGDAINLGTATEREINAYTRQKVHVGSRSIMDPKMGKCVRLRDREKGRDVARDSRARKNIFRRSVKGDGERERWSPGQGIVRKDRSTGVKVSIISGHCIQRYPTERNDGENGIEVGMSCQYLSLFSHFLLKRYYRALCAKVRNPCAENEF